jgi:hypothetical protein
VCPGKYAGRYRLHVEVMSAGWWLEASPLAGEAAAGEAPPHVQSISPWLPVVRPVVAGVNPLGNAFMMNRLPRPREMAVFVVMAIVCTVILAVTKKYDVGLALLGGPVFLVSAIMGLNRHAELNKPQAGSSTEQGAHPAEREQSQA